MEIKNIKDLVTDLNKLFGQKAVEFGSSYTWEKIDKQFPDSFILTIFSDADSSFSSNDLVVFVQTAQGVFELHNCTHYKIIDNEDVFFWKEDTDSVSCMVISRRATCSIFSNIDKKWLEVPIAELPNSRILAAAQISIFYNEN